MNRKRAAVLVAALVGAGAIAVDRWVVKVGLPGCVASVPELPRSQAVIVLGAAAWPDGEPTAVLRDRLEAGLAVYRAGKAEKLLLTGDHGRSTYDEVNAMRNYVLARGVPAEDVFCDHAGFTTYESLYRARDVFRVTRATIVTHAFHLPRAMYLARRLGIDGSGYACPESVRVKFVSRQVREPMARLKAFVAAEMWRPRPTYLGAVIPIAGDGRASWDRDATAGPPRTAPAAPKARAR